MLLLRNFQKSLLDPKIEPETPCSAVTLTTTRPTRQPISSMESGTVPSNYGNRLTPYHMDLIMVKIRYMGSGITCRNVHLYLTLRG
ncbi:hypothetical protein SFRURICE_014700 [Spodoptera frugiperda]|nr:hypothetical protein SFRURICE_014700 [Spodoptera frugiperda]